MPFKITTTHIITRINSAGNASDEENENPEDQNNIGSGDALGSLGGDSQKQISGPKAKHTIEMVTPSGKQEAASTEPKKLFRFFYGNPRVLKMVEKAVAYSESVEFDFEIGADHWRFEKDDDSFEAIVTVHQDLDCSGVYSAHRLTDRSGAFLLDSPHHSASLRFVRIGTSQASEGGQATYIKPVRETAGASRDTCSAQDASTHGARKHGAHKAERSKKREAEEAKEGSSKRSNTWSSPSNR